MKRQLVPAFESSGNSSYTDTDGYSTSITNIHTPAMIGPQSDPQIETDTPMMDQLNANVMNSKDSHSRSRSRSRTHNYSQHQQKIKIYEKLV